MAVEIPRRVIAASQHRGSIDGVPSERVAVRFDVSVNGPGSVLSDRNWGVFLGF